LARETESVAAARVYVELGVNALALQGVEVQKAVLVGNAKVVGSVYEDGRWGTWGDLEVGAIVGDLFRRRIVP
jgi:hypothetical protein